MTDLFAHKTQLSCSWLAELSRSKWALHVHSAFMVKISLRISIVLKLKKVEPKVRGKKKENYKCRELTKLYFFRLFLFSNFLFYFPPVIRFTGLCHKASEPHVNGWH